MEKQVYYSNGKLLITGEYLVLEGAMALAVPTIPGQKMIIEESDAPGILKWRSFFKTDCWFHVEFSLPELDILDTSERKKAAFLQKLLRAAHEINPSVFNRIDSILVKAVLDFHKDWGLGSSSSLMNNIAKWFGIDPFELFFKTQNGSGYDIACAQTNGPIWYRLHEGKPIAAHVIFDPPFSGNLAFVYSGRKQDSTNSICQYQKTKVVTQNTIERISRIGKKITLTETLEEFNALLDEHEEIMSKVLQFPKVKDQYFADFPGSIKSLGAWGGDFLLASSYIGFKEIKSYFEMKGLEVVFPFREMVFGLEA